MKEYIFHEKEHIEAMMNSNLDNETNITRVIKKLARYNYYVHGMNSEQNYDAIVACMKQKCTYFSEVGLYADINGCIKDAPKSAWKNVDAVLITKKELETISALNDIRQEKLAFVLLADAKYDNAYKQKNIHLSYLNNSDLYKFARVTMPIKDRSLFLHFLYEHNLVEINLNPTTTYKKLMYADSDDKDVGLILTENSYHELAFTYMNWKNGGGYKECKDCGRLFRTKKYGNQIYCKKCTPKHVLMEVKTVICQDCGAEVAIDAKDNKGCRCEDCQKKADYLPMVTKTITCVDCKKMVEVDSTSRAIRCPSCHVTYQKERNRIKNQAYRDRNSA